MSKERDHCIDVANEHGVEGCNHSAGHVKMAYWDFVRLLEAERAAAREEGRAEKRLIVIQQYRPGGDT